MSELRAGGVETVQHLPLDELLGRQPFDMGGLDDCVKFVKGERDRQAGPSVAHRYTLDRIVPIPVVQVHQFALLIVEGLLDRFVANLLRHHAFLVAQFCIKNGSLHDYPVIFSPDNQWSICVQKVGYPSQRGKSPAQWGAKSEAKMAVRPRP